jgi:hypothetical protein
MIFELHPFFTISAKIRVDPKISLHVSMWSIGHEYHDKLVSPREIQIVVGKIGADGGPSLQSSKSAEALTLNYPVPDLRYR